MDENPVDAAALLGAALAVVLAVLIAEGPFDYMNAAVAVTVLAILYAYQWNRPRARWELSLALSCTIGIVATLLVGLVGEIIESRSGFNLEGHIECHADGDNPAHYKCAMVSNLATWVTPCSWVIITVALFAIDRGRQKQRRTPVDQLDRDDGPSARTDGGAAAKEPPLEPGKSPSQTGQGHRAKEGSAKRKH
ncbi:hypothetical protein AWB80_06553 [Caballeronia pedi]|uniref:Transmembrane protein n=1 Tax=Caballeronia pedi TaxID=1777141 RepID=A0A158DA41_9BURK|nr:MULTISPECIES: hypothetical protein [Caballeronia]BCQ26246.1 hypothetical protein NK8_44300 [Caballeronia sp. NK8]SAK91351.1 hypothetical protein AWB80_06553 [Caballeronia pedi]